MDALKSRIYFVLIATAENANPNGDPLNGNRPRQHYDNTGYISAECIKRKMRNRLQDMGERILYQANDRSDDGLTNISDRINTVDGVEEARKKKDNKFIYDSICKEFIDVRAFGATIALKDKTSVGVRGAVTIQNAESVGPVDVESYQITKSLNGEPGADKGSDTMGMKHVVRYGTYVIRGAVNPILAGKTGFSVEDAEKVKKALATLFENDESSARPAGSMSVRKLYWYVQEEGDEVIPPEEVYDSVDITVTDPDGMARTWDDIDIKLNDIGVKPEIIVDR